MLGGELGLEAGEKFRGVARAGELGEPPPFHGFGGIGGAGFGVGGHDAEVEARTGVAELRGLREEGGGAGRVARGEVALVEQHREFEGGVGVGRGGGFKEGADAGGVGLGVGAVEEEHREVELAEGVARGGGLFEAREGAGGVTRAAKALGGRGCRGGRRPRGRFSRRLFHTTRGRK